MIRKKLKNGLTIIAKDSPLNSLTAHVTVKVGSNDESNENRGISHFIEHLIFEGTKNRTALEISREIEGIGGSIGAYTSNKRTCYYVKTLRKHAQKSLDVLSDIISNPLFSKEAIEKERNIILSEVSTRNDNPRFYQWTLFQKNLFEKNPAKHPIIGYEKIIKKITREQILNYYQKNYSSKNMIIILIGKGASKLIKYIENKFINLPNKSVKKLKYNEPSQKKIKKASEKKELSHSYLVIGFKTPSRVHKDSFKLELIRSILGRPLSGRLYDEFRNKRSLAYDFGCYNESEPDYGFFALYISTEHKNLAKSKKIILDEIKKLDNLSNKDLKESKNYLIGEFILDNEDSFKEASELSLWEECGDFKKIKSYSKEINKISKAQIIKTRDKYLAGPYTEIILKQKKVKKK